MRPTHLAAGLGCALVVAVFAGSLWASRTSQEATRGRWFPYRTHRFDPALSDHQLAEIAELEALGYVGGTLPPPEREAGVFLHSPDAWRGPRFYVSGEGPVARIIDEAGRTHHEWRGDFWSAFPDYPISKDHGSTQNWRRARLLSDGSVLAVHEGLGMVRLDRESRLLWANPGRYHHDLHRVGDEVIALGREARVVPAFDPVRPVLEDRVAWLRVSDGVETREISILQAVLDSPYAGELLGEPRRSDGDLLHTNALWVLDGRLEPQNSALAAGNLLLSFRQPSALAVLDPGAGAVVWLKRGPWVAQHDPQPDGRGAILLFDNLGGPNGAARLAWLDPNGFVSRTWTGIGEPLRSSILGAVEPLPDGSVWVAESERGTVWEVSTGGTVRWAWANPARAGTRDEFIAAVFEMQPVDPQVFAGLR